MAASMANSKMRYFKEQMSAALGSSSVVVKIVACALAVGYLLSFITYAVPYITVTPGYVMPPNARVYSFFTYCFVELHFWHVVADIAVVILFGKLLEPLWGAPDMLLYFVVVNLGVGLITAVCYIVVYLATLNDDYLFEVHIYGQAGYIAGFCVAVKQVMPDHCVAALPLGKLRNTHIPLLLLVITILLRVVGLLPGPYPFMFGWGVIVSWVYLRFYQKHTNGNRGDMADNFSFASFFPNQLQPIVSVICNSVFNGLVKIKVCKKPQRRYDVSSPTTITVTLPGTEPHDAERRKQLALKALNDRLTKSDSQTAWPSMDDDAPVSPTSDTERTDTSSSGTLTAPSSVSSTSTTSKSPVPETTAKDTTGGT